MYSSEQKLFKNSATFVFESTYVHEELLGDTKAATWIRKHAPFSVSFSSRLVAEPFFFCSSDPHFFPYFIAALGCLASQSTAKLKQLFHDIETSIFIELSRILEKLTHRHNRRERVRSFNTNHNDCANKIFASTQFIQIQRSQLIDLQEHLERFRKVLPLFGVNSAKLDLNLIKFYLLPIFKNERCIEPTVIKRTN